MKWLIYGLLAFLLYLVFQHHPTLVIYCVVAYLFWRYVISPTKMTTEKQHLLLAKAQDIKMGKLVKSLEMIVVQLDRLASLPDLAESAEDPEYQKDEEYDTIHA